MNKKVGFWVVIAEMKAGMPQKFFTNSQFARSLVFCFSLCVGNHGCFFFFSFFIERLNESLNPLQAWETLLVFLL